eukprot:scaffold44848_cov66-Phaeocystis_antarctica.AAC.8
MPEAQHPCLDCLDLPFSKPARRTRKRGTEQQARTRDTPRAKQSYKNNRPLRTFIEHRTQLIIRSAGLGDCSQPTPR